MKIFLQRVGAHKSEVVDNIRSRVEYQPPGSSKRYDIYIKRDEPTLSIAIELKRDETGLDEMQLREYLSMLRILREDRSLRRSKNSPKYSKLVVITGATEQPEMIKKLMNASGGFLQNHLVWLSWYELSDIITELELEGETLHSPNVKNLAQLLAEQGYVSQEMALPTLREQARTLGALGVVNLDRRVALDNEMEILETTLGRIEYQMAKLNFGLPIQVNVKGRRKKSVSKQRAFRLGHSVKVLGTNARSVARLFVPNDEIEYFYSNAKKTSKQNSGVGLAFSIHSRGWIAVIKPIKQKPLPPDFVQFHRSSERIPIDYKDEGMHGWVLKGTQKQPAKAARFLARAWNDYIERTK